MTRWVRPSGGLLFHWRARRQKRRWQNFNSSIATWLQNWRVDPQELILIGPSGGYTLPSAWLSQFKKVIAFDIDPLAIRMFQRQHHLAHLEFHRSDVFWKNTKLNLEALTQILKRYPQASLLFCNVLGQIPLEGTVTSEAWKKFLQDLRQCLANRAWASYHDRFTIEPVEPTQHERVFLKVTQSTDLQSGLNSLKLPASITAVDHDMDGPWLQGLSINNFYWSLTPTCLHIIGAVQVEC